jgi:hypothetical protein
MTDVIAKIARQYRLKPNTLKKIEFSVPGIKLYVSIWTVDSIFNRMPRPKMNCFYALGDV